MRSISPMEVDTNLRQKIFLIEKEMLKVPQVKLPLFHYFLPGLYLRELHIPAGATTTSKIHKHAFINFLTKGERSTLVDGKIERIRAPHFHISPPGMKRISYTHEDSIWITAHFTSGTEIENETNPDKLEKYLACDTEQEYLDFTRMISCQL